jgi:reactive chlorine resistance protein C
MTNATLQEMKTRKIGGIEGDSKALSGVTRLYIAASRLDRIGMGVLRLGLVIVLVWIGGLKFAKYEADGIVPLVSQSPLMSYFYHHPAPEYRQYMNKEGELNAAHRAWHESNGTYAFSHGLGIVIILIGLLIALHPVLPQVATVGSFLLIFMACTTLSFLATTPEAWVPALGDTTHGFPYLSGAGRLIVKDCIMLGAAVTTMAESAGEYLCRNSQLVQRKYLPRQR